MPLGQLTVFEYMRIFSIQLQFFEKKFLLMQLQFKNFPNYLCSYSFFPELILHKFSVEGYTNARGELIERGRMFFLGDAPHQRHLLRIAFNSSAKP